MLRRMLILCNPGFIRGNKSVWQPVVEQVRGYSINYTDVGINRKEIFAFKVE